MISPARLWWGIPRDLKRGWSATRHHYWTLPRIQQWQWPYWGEPPAPVPVHLLTSADDWLLAAWMLASWFHFTGQNWRVTVHDDGTLPPNAARTFARLFRGVRIVARDEADATMERLLTPFPFCADFRKSHRRALKVFDLPHFAESEQVLVFDSDLLFFRRPNEILDWVASASEECWFNEDLQEGSLINAREAASELQVELWPRVNSGLCLLQKSALDLDLCDRALAETSILRGPVEKIEQTLLALCASRHGRGGLLPPAYEVSTSRGAKPEAISRHYTRALRDRFYGDGLKRIRAELLPDED